MSSPNPINITTSTTFINVNPLQSPYTPVYLNNIVFPGQLVTVFDGTSSIGALTNPIVLSTLTQSFADGTTSTLINQPQGYITAQSLPTNQWAFLNSYPFRGEYTSAGLQIFNTSNLFTALVSSIQDFTSSIVVENLVVTGNFFQSSGLILNTNLSSLGTVDFVSSITIWGTSYFSANVSSIGQMNLNSSLNVYDSLLSKSSLVTSSFMSVGGSLFSLSSISAPLIQLRGGVYGTSLDVQTSTQTTLVAAQIQIDRDLSTLGSAFIGGSVQANRLAVKNDIAFYSSASLHQDVSISSFICTSREALVRGGFSVGETISIGQDLFTQSSIHINGSFYTAGLMRVGSTLSVSTLQTNTFNVFSNYSAVSSVTQASTLTTNQSLGVGILTASTTTIGTSISIGSNLVVLSNLNIEGQTLIKQSLSTLSFVSMGANLSIEKSLSVNQTAYISTFFSTSSNVDVLYSTINTSTIVRSSMFGLGNLIVGGTLTISSIILPPNLTGNNFTTNNLSFNGTSIVNSAAINTLGTSTITIGYIPQTDFKFDMIGSVFMKNATMSSLFLSTNDYVVGTGSNSYFYVSKSMGVGVKPGSNDFVVAPYSYFPSSPMILFSTLSTNVVTGDIVNAALIGDASQMTDFQYPKNISALTLLVTDRFQMNTNNSFVLASSIETSTLQNEGTLINNSSMSVGPLEIWGNANGIVRWLQRNVIQTSVDENEIVINDVVMKTNGQGQMLINEDLKGGTPFTASLGVFSTLGVTTLLTNYNLKIDTFRGDTVYTSSLYGYGGAPFSEQIGFTAYGSIYVSSGSISTTAGSLILSESDIYNPNVNAIQTYQSTLAFNSTLFVDRAISSVGIGTKPNFNLDAERILVNNTTYNILQSTLNRISFPQIPSTQTYAFSDADGLYSNLTYSSNLTQWQNVNTFFSNANYVSYFTPGFTATNALLPNERLPSEFFLGTLLTSNLGIIVSPFYLLNSVVFVINNALTTIAPDTFRSMATDGYRYVATGTTRPLTGIANSNQLFYTEDLYNFSPTSISCNYFPAWGRSNGGYDIIYGGMNDKTWIVVGGGLNATAYRSLDGINWSNVYTGMDELHSIISFQTMETNATIYMAAGGYLTTDSNIQLGRVTYSQDSGISWIVDSGFYFSGSANDLATDGQKIVVVGEDSGGATMWYSYITQTCYFNWIQCQGSLFTTRGNAVQWNGSSWLAAGDDGFRESYDGITWFTPISNISKEFYNLGYTSNATSIIRVASTNTLHFQDSPSLECQKLLSVPTISFYPSSILNINNACILDTVQNIIVPGSVTSISPLQNTSFKSTFYALDAYVSSFVSTQQLVLGAYYLQIQSV
jgi:predicted acyltransferase (DUF342 family)